MYQIPKKVSYEFIIFYPNLPNCPNSREVFSAILPTCKVMKRNIRNKIKRIFVFFEECRHYVCKKKEILAWKVQGFPVLYDKRAKHLKIETVKLYSLTSKSIKFTSEIPCKYIIKINIRQNHNVSTALLHHWNSTAKTPKLCPM